MVDGLLASPAYGERWARHWLDIVRFGESQGFEYDIIRDNAWRYRDYVVRALNADVPYPRFVCEQIAGDVIERVTADSIAATGLLVAGPWDQAGNGSASPTLRAQVREAELEDMVGTVAQTFLGVTLNCARCHAHKFDPIPQADYYRVRAVFAGVFHGDRSVVSTEEKQARAEAELVRRRRLEELGRRLVELDVEADRSAGVADPGVPVPFARWSFSGGIEDSAGDLAGQMTGGARVEAGRLVLDGRDGQFRTPPLGRDLAEFTLETWLTLDDLAQQGVGAVTIENEAGTEFDSLVFGERQPRRWMAGSEFHRRSRDLEAPDEIAGPGERVHMAMACRADGRVTLFRNGRVLGSSYRVGDGARPVRGADSRILIGRRHSAASGGFLKGAIDEVRVYARALDDNEVARSYEAGPGAKLPTWADRDRHRTPASMSERIRLLGERARLQKPMATPPDPVAYAANPRVPELTHVLARGEPSKPGERVAPAGLGLFEGLPGDLGLAPDAPESDRRRRFAEWVASPANPLTARVIVNRVWQYHFGRGLVATPNDFGRMGERPTHPELLDWLASWFNDPARGNGSLKALHRLILTSAAFARASEPLPIDVSRLQPGVDPSALLAWFTPRRLEAEAVRDAMLSVSGMLNRQLGGPGFRPFEHRGGGGQNEYFATDPEGPAFARRTVYRICVHSARDPMLDSLDCPEFSTRTPVRPSTTTPLQALSLLNGTFVQRQSHLAADRVMQWRPGSLASQVDALWRLAVGRAPTADEFARALAVARDGGLSDVAWALFNSNEFVQLR